jgi:dihydroneopterin aldolase
LKERLVDRIYLEDLRVEAVIGIWEWERRVRQVISLDLELATDARRAAKTDEIADALDYKSIAKRVAAVVEQSEFRLVETLAETLARIVITEFGVSWLKLTVSKPGAIEGSRNVGIIVERSASDYA